MPISIHRTKKRDALRLVEVRGLTQDVEEVVRLVKLIKLALSCNGIVRDETDGSTTMILQTTEIDRVKDMVADHLGASFAQNGSTIPFHYVQT